MKRKGILLGVILLGIMQIQSGPLSFFEYDNPVFSPGRAYYPTVIYDAFHFGDIYTKVPYYKMWYTSAAGIALAYSEDGIQWYSYGMVAGVPTAHHAHVIYDRNGFGGTVYYKMWFWDTSASIYSLAALKYAESLDGITWVQSSLTQDAGKPLVTGMSPDWNRGTYGPVDVFYNALGSAVLDDSDIWNNKYVMYYDATTGGTEQVGLGYSVDGLHWKRYTDQPVLPISPGEWDSSYAGFGTVVKVDKYYFFYSGGQTRIHEGIGYAFSEDGIVWQKADTPIFHISDSVFWRQNRCYTPSVLLVIRGTKACFRMWFAGDDGSTRAIGYAEGCIPLPLQKGPKKNTERDIQQQMTALARFNFDKCCEKNEDMITTLLTTLEADESAVYGEALLYLEKARYYCSKSEELIASGNTVAGNYCAVQSCHLYAEAIRLLQTLMEDT